MNLFQKTWELLKKLRHHILNHEAQSPPVPEMLTDLKVVEFQLTLNFELKFELRFELE